MRFLIVGLNYLPESTSIGPYTADLAKCLMERGHQVQVLTAFPMAPQWRIWDGYRGKYFMREAINGVPLLRSYVYVPKQPNKTINRILFDLSFSLSSLMAGLAVAGCDLVVGISPPLQLGLAAYLISKYKRARFFFHIQDIVPDAAIATGMLRESSFSVRIARAMETFLYARAASIGVISEGFAQNLKAKRVAPEKIALLPNWVDLLFIRPMQRDNDFRQQNHLEPDKFVVMYSGSIAGKQGLETLVEAGGLLQHHKEIVICIIGEGPRLSFLKERAGELGLQNVKFLPLQPYDQLPIQLAAADVLVITQKGTVKDIVLPGKLGFYMASGRPVLAAVHPQSETARYVLKAQAGLVVQPEDPQALVDGILSMRDATRGATSNWGRNGRCFAEEWFDKNKALERFAAHLEHLVAT